MLSINSNSCQRPVFEVGSVSNSSLTSYVTHLPCTKCSVNTIIPLSMSLISYFPQALILFFVHLHKHPLNSKSIEVVAMF